MKDTASSDEWLVIQWALSRCKHLETDDPTLVLLKAGASRIEQRMNDEMAKW